MSCEICSEEKTDLRIISAGYGRTKEACTECIEAGWGDYKNFGNFNFELDRLRACMMQLDEIAHTVNNPSFINHDFSEEVEIVAKGMKTILDAVMQHHRTANQAPSHSAAVELEDHTRVD
jgi:hypothetical protein